MVPGQICMKCKQQTHNLQTLVKKDNSICHKKSNNISTDACKITIFWSLTKAVNPVPFIGKCHQFKLFQNDIYSPRVRDEMVDIWS